MPNTSTSNYYDYYVVVESALDGTTLRDNFQILGQFKSSDGILSYLKFVSCIMEVNCRNRNHRYWGKDHMQIMLQAPHIVDYFNRAGGLPGENGHPIPAVGKLTMERLVTIDPNNMAVLFKKWWWDGDRLMAEVETLDQGEGTPGNRMMRNMIQGMIPAFSARTMVPQRRNADGTIDVTGPGRLATFDRVNGPSCENAYMDISIPVKNIVTQSDFNQVMESYTNYVMERSETVKRVMDGMVPAMESCLLTQDGYLHASVPERHETLLIPVERYFRREISSFMRSF